VEGDDDELLGGPFELIGPVNAKPGHFPGGAHVHGDVQTGGDRALRRGMVDDANLQPHGLSAHRNRLVDHRAGNFAPTKNVHHIDGRWNVGQGRVHTLAENGLAGVSRIDGDYLSDEKWKRRECEQHHERASGRCARTIDTRVKG
jgi:hypothetical protein